jgi:hypothetical protein
MRLLLCLLLFASSESLSAQRSTNYPIVGWGPSTKWHLDSRVNRCVAERSYLAGDYKAALGFDWIPYSSDVVVRIKLPHKISRATSGVRGTVAFGNREYALKDISVLPGQADSALYSFTISSDIPAETGTVGRLKFSAQNKSIELPLSDIGMVLDELNACVADLLSTWGLSAEAQGRLASAPKPIAGRKMFHEDDFPDRALYYFGGGAVHALVSVKPDGSVGACRVADGSGNDEIDAATCLSIRKRAKFSPAVDKAGRPMEAPSIISVNWKVQ